MNIFKSHRFVLIILTLTVHHSWASTLDEHVSNISALTLAAQQGDPAAQTNLSRVYLFGPQDVRDEEKAVSWLTQAANKSYGPAEYLYGIVLTANKQDRSQHLKGADYLSRAALHGCAGAAGLFGNILLAASSKNPTLETGAVTYIRQAAKGGDYMSQTLLAKLYSAGLNGVEQDTITAYAWLKFARMEHPNHKFAKLVEQLETELKSSLDETELKQTETLATELNTQLGKTQHEFCSQSLPDDMQRHLP